MNNKIVYFTILTLFIIFITNSCDKVTEPGWIPDNIDETDYELVWSDEFNQRSATLDSSKWNYNLGYGEGGWGNDEWQNYTCDTTNIKLEGGDLIISAQCPSGTPGKRDGSVTSARINTKDKFSFKYGKVKARIKAPTGTGMWPAFWMLGSSIDFVGWPQCGEIDITEISPFLYGDKTTMCTIHWWDENEEANLNYGTQRQLNQSLSDDYHIYEIEWDAKRIVGKIDGITYMVKVIDPALMSEFFNDFFLILNLAVGGNLGGAPDGSTVWPQNLIVDWIRIYQIEQEEENIESFGIFTDQTPVDAALEIGTNAEIYIWANEFTFEPTLATGLISPYEGDNVISWVTTGDAWFGGGFSSIMPLDLSDFEEGNLKFMIKIPQNVGFKIGIIDIHGNQGTSNHWVEFPANQTAFGLVRDGEWGQATIPVEDLKGQVDLGMLDYAFYIGNLVDNTQCQFAIDDIYWDGGGMPMESSVNFDAASYDISATNASVSVADEVAADSMVTIEVDNGTDTINIDVNLDGDGNGSSGLNFGPTNDETDTIEIAEGDVLTATYIDAAGETRTDTADIISAGGTIGIYTESHNAQMLSYSQIVNSADWEGHGASPDEESTAVTPVDGTYVLGVEFTEIGGADWSGIAFDFRSSLPDVSSYTKVIFNVNKVNMPMMSDLWVKFEDNSGGQEELNIADYTPTFNGQWERYEIPFSDYEEIDFTNLKYFLFVNPSDGTNLLFSNLYFDDVYLSQ